VVGLLLKSQELDENGQFGWRVDFELTCASGSVMWRFLGGRGVVHHHPALALDLIDDHNRGAGAEGGNEDADGGLGRELLVLFWGDLP